MTDPRIGSDDDTGQVQNPDARVAPEFTQQQQDAARELATAAESLRQAQVELDNAAAVAESVGLDVAVVLESAQPPNPTPAQPEG